MALVTEDGTGLADAESYVSVADSDTILSKYNKTDYWSTLSTSEKEARLRLATRFIDMNMNFASKPLTFDSDTDDQALSFPREEFKDKLGRKISGIPDVLKESTAFIAGENVSLLEPEEPGVKSESFGDSEIEWSRPQRKANPSDYLKILKSLGYGSGANIVEVFRA